MQKYLISNPRFLGEAHITYNNEGNLIIIDLSNTNLNSTILQAFKNAIPPTEDQLINGNSFTQATKIIEENYTVTFEQFWQRYPLHRNRYKAEIVYNKLSVSIQIQAYENLQQYIKYCKRNASYYTPMLADRYLRTREYETNWNKL